MSTVVMHAVVSVDGFIADDHDEVGSLFDWYFSGDRPLFDGTGDSALQYVDQRTFVRLCQTLLEQHPLRSSDSTCSTSPTAGRRSRPRASTSSSCPTGRSQTAGIPRLTFLSWTTSRRRSRLRGSSPTVGR